MLGCPQARNALEQEILLFGRVLQQLTHKIGRSNGHTKKHHTLLCSRQLGVSPPDNGLGFDHSDQSGELQNTWWCDSATFPHLRLEMVCADLCMASELFINDRDHCTNSGLQIMVMSSK